MSLMKFLFPCCGLASGPCLKAGWPVREVSAEVMGGLPQEGRCSPPEHIGLCLACEGPWPLTLTFFGSRDDESGYCQNMNPCFPV